MTKKDTIYQGVIGAIKPFEFNEQVADVFPDMIQRSVPGYAETLHTLSLLAQRYAVSNSHIYDLGCSLGAASIALGKSLKDKQCTIMAVDNSKAMIERCRKNLSRASLACNVELHEADIREIPVVNASIVVMNYTLQFVPVAERSKIMNTIYNGLLANGICVISEKICFTDPLEQQQMNTLHETFKRMNGYDDMEITAKRNALENVLVCETRKQHEQRLYDAGFSSVTQIRQSCNFITLLAIK